MVTLLAPDVLCNSGKDLESPFWHVKKNCSWCLKEYRRQVMISIVPGRMSVKFLGIKLFVQSLCENKINQSKTSKTFVCHKLQLFNMYGTVALLHSKLF